MIVEVLRTLLAIALLVVLPGWLLVLALFPRAAMGFGVRAYVILAGGVLLVMAESLLLGFLPHAERGSLQSLALDGMPNVELLTLAACVGLAWVALRRGALPWLETRMPASWRPQAKAEATRAR